MSLSVCPSLLPVFLLIGGSVVSVKAFDTQTQIDCPYESGCQALVKQADDLKKLKETLDRNLASTAFISKQLETLSADLSRHDERLKALIESQGADLVEVKLNLFGQTATQSSTYTHSKCTSSSGYCVASLAIDGNYNSDFHAGTCATTNAIAGESSWWRVDLGQPFKVQRIMIVNRGDCCGERLDNFVVGLSNSSAVPVKGNYAICGYYPGPTANGAHLSLHCNPGTASGRYVIVQQSVNGDGYLTICEIEIYVEQLRNHVHKPQDYSSVRARGH